MIIIKIGNSIISISNKDSDLISWKWRINSEGYAVTGKATSMHRKILERKMGRSLMGGERVDHRDFNKLNNCRLNLRVANASQNRAYRKIDKTNTSGYKGVSWSKQTKRWRAAIECNDKTFFLGYFMDKESAACAYDIKAKELFGEFAYLNFNITFGEEFNLLILFFLFEPINKK